MYTVGAQCTLGQGGTGGDWTEIAQSLSLRCKSERTLRVWPQCRKLNRGIFRTDGARPLQTLSCSGQVWGREGAACPTWVPVPAGPPAASPFLPCRGPTHRGVCPAVIRAPPRGNGAATAPAGTAGVETGPSQLGHRRSCRRSARGREQPLTQRWPCPQAGPASRGKRPSGPDWHFWVSTPLFLGLSFQPTSAPTAARCWAGNQEAIRPAALRSPPQPRPLQSGTPTQSCEAGACAPGWGFRGGPVPVPSPETLYINGGRRPAWSLPSSGSPDIPHSLPFPGPPPSPHPIPLSSFPSPPPVPLSSPDAQSRGADSGLTTAGPESRSQHAKEASSLFLVPKPWLGIRKGKLAFLLPTVSGSGREVHPGP